MVKLEEELKPLILKYVEFKIGDKVIKKGKIKIFNTKQFFIKFKIDNGLDTKEYEIPYPFKVEKIPSGFMFDYCLSAFVPKTEESFWKMRTMNTSESSKLHENYLYIVSLSS